MVDVSPCRRTRTEFLVGTAVNNYLKTVTSRVDFEAEHYASLRLSVLLDVRQQDRLIFEQCELAVAVDCRVNPNWGVHDLPPSVLRKTD